MLGSFRVASCWIVSATLVALFGSTAQSAEQANPQWMWVNTSGARSDRAHFRKVFTAAQRPLEAHLWVAADFHEAAVYLNGQQVAVIEDFHPPLRLDVTQWLKPKSNVLAIGGAKRSGPAAVAAKLTLRFADDSRQQIVSDASWLAAAKEQNGWHDISFKANGWKAPMLLGSLAGGPWGGQGEDFGITPLDDYTQWKQAIGAEKGSDPATFFVLPGFEIQLLRSAAPDEDSWISIAFDPQGRAVIGLESKGLLRLTLPAGKASDVRVERINDTLKECRGLVFAHDSLFVNASESKGLFRLRDTNGDDQFDEVKQLFQSPGGSGHGRNSLALGPDGKIYAIHGDSVDVPLQLPNLTSPLRDHSRGKKTKQGFVIRGDKDGKGWELVTAGLRNPYGIAFNKDGEMFTYDADAEYDNGSPWYRPTRVHHLLPGGDYGWRGVTRSWPPYYPDVPDAAPPNIDVGKGSPTAVMFAAGSNFPPKFRRALFALDWAYGRIVAVHLTPRGASYTGQPETFLKGRPLNVTGIDFGPDGAMYVVTGGRKTKSGLYRIRYVGPEVKEQPPTKQQLARSQHAEKARAERRKLEAFHGRQDGRIVDKAWPHLNDPDPWLRHAARIAVEHQPLESWQPRALAEARTAASLTALLSLSQGCSQEVLPAIVERVDQLSWQELTESQKWTAVRIYELCLARSSADPGTIKAKILARLDPLYPDVSPRINQALSLLLARLGAPRLVPRTMALLADTNVQSEQLQYLFVLRDIRADWTPPLREDYFRWFPRMKQFTGGEGMPTFIARIKSDALAALDESERQRMKTLLASLEKPLNLPAETTSRPFVRQWQAEDLLDALPQVAKGRDFERGKRMFTAANCVHCHRVRHVGAAIGPDLTSLAGRFARQDILRSVISPSQVVAEQYRTDIVETVHGKVLSGRILQGGDYRAAELHIQTDPLRADSIVTIAKHDVQEHRKSPVSLMPEGLFNTLSQDEILDLLAYLEAAGDKNRPNFKP